MPTVHKNIKTCPEGRRRYLRRRASGGQVVGQAGAVGAPGDTPREYIQRLRSSTPWQALLSVGFTPKLLCQTILRRITTKTGSTVVDF